MKEFYKIMRDIKVFRTLLEVIVIISLLYALVFGNILYHFLNGEVSKLSFLILTLILLVFIRLTLILLPVFDKKIEKLKAVYKTNLSFKGDNSTILELLNSTDKIFLKGPDVDDCIVIIIISLYPLPARVKYKIIEKDKFQRVFFEL